MIRTRFIIIISVISLLLLGVVMQAGFSGVSHAPMWRHSFYLALGVMAMVFAERVDYRVWCRHSPLLFSLSIFLLVLVLIPHIGVTINGAARLINFGPISVMPSTVAELALIILLASWRRNEAQLNVRTVGVLIVSLLAAVMLVNAEPDLIRAFLILLTGLVVIAVRGYWKPALMTGFAVIVSAAFLLMRNPNRMVRLIAYFSCRDEPRCHPPFYFALQAGGWTGVGLGNGAEMAHVPFVSGEFMAARIGEALGLIGLFAMLLVYVALAVAGILASMRASDRRARTLGIGIVSLIAFQTFIHIGVIFEWLPFKSLPLPFVSNGGTDLVVMLAAVGILLNIARSDQQTILSGE